MSEQSIQVVPGVSFTAWKCFPRMPFSINKLIIESSWFSSPKEDMFPCFWNIEITAYPMLQASNSWQFRFGCCHVVWIPRFNYNSSLSFYTPNCEKFDHLLASFWPGELADPPDPNSASLPLEILDCSSREEAGNRMLQVCEAPCLSP